MRSFFFLFIYFVISVEFFLNENVNECKIETRLYSKNGKLLSIVLVVIDFM